MSDLVMALKPEAEAGVRKCQTFEALTDCVACGDIATHGLRAVVDGFVPRVCNSCGFEWRQFA